MDADNFKAISQGPLTQKGISAMSSEHTEECGAQILELYKYCCTKNKDSKFLRKIMEGHIMGYLQGRLSKKETGNLKTMFTPQQRKTFETIVSVAKKNFENRGGYNPQRGNGDNYTKINDPNHPSKSGSKMRIQDGREVTVTYKEYFTFTPTSKDPGEVLAEANRFYTGLFLAYQKLQKRGLQNGSGVAMKFKDDLDGLMRDLDSAVFYVDNLQAAKLVRQVVDEELKAAHLRTDRSGRTGSGFDLEFPNGDALSHRQLIAKAGAKVIDADFHGQRVILSYTAKRFGEGIEQRANQAGKLTPEQMIQAIA